METKTLIRNKFFNDDDEYCCEEIILNDKIKTKAWILITHSYLNQCPKKLNKKEVVEKCKDCWIKFEEKDFELEYLYCFFMKHAPTGRLRDTFRTMDWESIKEEVSDLESIIH